MRLVSFILFSVIALGARVNRANDEDDFARRWQPNTFHGNDGTHRPVAIS